MEEELKVAFYVPLFYFSSSGDKYFRSNESKQIPFH